MTIFMMMMMTQDLRYVGTYDIWWIETVGGQLWPLHNMDAYIISLYYALLGYQRRPNTNKCEGPHWSFAQRFLTTFFCRHQMALCPRWFCPLGWAWIISAMCLSIPLLPPYFVPALVFLGLISHCWPTRGVRPCNLGTLKEGGPWPGRRRRSISRGFGCLGARSPLVSHPGMFTGR